jgi:DNA polymerase-3 subunit delta
MKLSPRDANGFFQRPDPACPGVLIFGEDSMRVALKRQELVANIVGPEGEGEMRPTRMNGGDLRRDGAALLDAVKAQGFFPGPRAVLVEDATDSLSKLFEAALADWRPGDAQIVATAGQLTARSALRKLFEGHPAARAAAIYNDPMGRAEIEAELGKAGMGAVSRDAMAALEDLGRSLAPGDFRQVIEKIALYKRGDDSELSAEEVALSAPATIEAEIDDIFHIVAEGRTEDIAPLMQRLAAQGVAPVTLMIFGARHFRTLYAAASAPGGAAEGISRLRPLVFGPRRDRMLRQLRNWPPAKLEAALTVIMDTDLTLRSAGQKAPAMALVERSFVRLASLARR